SAGLETCPSGGTDAFARRVNVSGRLSIGQLEDEVRALQAAGRVAILVAGNEPGALRAADIGLGVELPGSRVPSAAHLMVGPGLVNPRRVVNAVPKARDASGRSALLALGGASTGGICASMGPATGPAP